MFAKRKAKNNKLNDGLSTFFNEEGVAKTRANPQRIVTRQSEFFITNLNRMLYKINSPLLFNRRSELDSDNNSTTITIRASQAQKDPLDRALKFSIHPIQNHRNGTAEVTLKILDPDNNDKLISEKTFNNLRTREDYSATSSFIKDLFKDKFMDEENALNWPKDKQGRLPTRSFLKNLRRKITDFSNRRPL